MIKKTSKPPRIEKARYLKGIENELREHFKDASIRVSLSVRGKSYTYCIEHVKETEKGFEIKPPSFDLIHKALQLAISRHSPCDDVNAGPTISEERVVALI